MCLVKNINMFDPIFKIKEWLALRKAKKLEQEPVPNNAKIQRERQEFVFEAKELKKMVTRPEKAQKPKK